MKNIGFYLVLVFLISFIFEITFDFDLSDIPGISLKNLSVYIMIIFIFFQSFLIKKPILLKNKFNIPIIVFIVYCFLSLFLNYLIDPTIYKSLNSEIINFKNYMDSFIMAILVFNLVNDKKSIIILLISLLCLQFILNCITILGNFGVFLNESERMVMDTKHGRIGGAFGSSNDYAAYIALFMPLWLNAFFNIRNFFAKFALGIMLLLNIYSLLLTGSRGGFLAFFVGISALILFNAKKISFALLFKIITAFFAIGLIVGVSYVFLPEMSKAGIKRNVIERAKYQSLDEYSGGRLGFWSKGLKLFIQNPFTGTGWNTFVKLINANSHNDYLLFLTTLGAVGFSIVLWILYCLYSSAIENRKLAENNKWYYNSYLSGFFSIATSMFFVNMRNTYLFFFIYTALVLKMGYFGKTNVKEIRKELTKSNSENA